MARARRMRGRARQTGVAASLKALVESVAERVVERMRGQLPAREQLRQIERQVRRLARRVNASRRAGARRVGRPRSNRRCTVRGCGLPHVAQGLCSRHYQARRRGRLRDAAARRRR